MTNTYRKSRTHAPQGFFEAEAFGLKWLAEAQSLGGVRIAKVISYSEDELLLERIETSTPDTKKAFDFGAKLAVMHKVGAPSFGYAPSNYAYFGPLDDPIPTKTPTKNLAFSAEYDNFFDYFIQGRLLPMIEQGISRKVFSDDIYAHTLQTLSEYREAHESDATENAWAIAKPSRIHGDLWSGNLLWAQDECVLIDPSARGGHAEEDLAMLSLFGCSFFSEIIAGYQSVTKLAPGFKERFTLHNLFPIAAHAVIFDGGYVGQYLSMLRVVLSSCA